MAAQAPDARQIFLDAVEKHSPDEWPALLDAACGADTALRERVEALLKAHGQYNQLLDGEGFVATINQPLSERPGSQIGPYKLLQQIGEGGMGVVYMAEQTQPVQRKVALKVIKAGMDTHQVVARFEAERQALAMMDHVNIARVLDAGATENGRPYFVMELVHGVPITKYCDDNHLTPRQRLELFVPVCQAIQHAHQKGIIHRDIKPSNVMVTLYDGKPVPKVIDFGVAKATEQKLTERTVFTQFGTMVGTLEYMSPEQAEMSALGIDTRSDIYSLGVLLYELLTGSTPLSSKRIRAAAYAEILRIIKEEEPPKPSTRLSDSGEALASISAQRHTEPAKLTKLVRGELDWIVMKTLEKDRNRRYETANDLAMDVQRFLSDDAVAACPPSVGYRFRKFARRNKVMLATTAAIAFSILGGIVGTTWQAIQATRERDRAVTAEGLAQERLMRAERAESRAKGEAQRAETEAERSRTEAAIAEAINRFLTNDLLAMARPMNEPNRDITLRVILDRAAEKIGERFADQPVVEAAVRHTIGYAYQGLGMPETAQRHFERAWKLRKESLGEEHPDSLRSLQEQGWVRLRQGYYQEAADIFFKTLEIRQRVFGEEHRDTQFAMDALGQSYLRLNRSTEAEHLFQKVFVVRRRVLGEEHVLTAESMSLLGWLYTNTKRYSEAEPLLFKALAIRQRDLGDENPNTLNSMNALAALYREQGNYGDAEAMLLKGLEIRRRVFGETHPGIVDSMSCLAKLYSMQGNYTEAENWYVKALETGRLSLRQDHPEMRWYRDELAQVYLKHGSSLGISGDWKQVITIFIKAVELNPELLYPVFVELKAKGKLAEAETPLRRALTFFEKQAADFPEEVRYQKRVADIQVRLGQAIGHSRPAEFESCFRAAITGYEKLVANSPENSTYRQDLGQSYKWLASSLDRTTKIPEREQLWRQAAEQFEVLLNLDDGSSRAQYQRYALADTYRALADDVALQKRTVEAEAIYNQAQDQFTRVTAEQLTGSADNPILRRQSLSASFKNLTNLLVAAGRTHEAVHVCQKAITVYTKLAAERPDEAYFREELVKRQAELEQLKAKP